MSGTEKERDGGLKNFFSHNNIILLFWNFSIHFHLSLVVISMDTSLFRIRSGA